MKKRMTIGILAALALTIFTGCAELHTREPFGEVTETKPEDWKRISGTWYTATRSVSGWQSFEVAPATDGKSGKIISRSARGKPHAYDALFRQIKGLNDTGGVVIFFKETGVKESGWRFAWVGQPFPSSSYPDIEDQWESLVLVFPDAKFAKHAGLKTTESSYASIGSGVPTVGLIDERPEKFTDAAWNEAKSARMTVHTLADSPERIMEVLKQHDLRTMMLPTSPMVLTRYDLRALPAKPTPKLIPSDRP